MKNLFNQADVTEMISRMEKLTPETHRLWGKMNVAQMLAHCNVGMETAMGLNHIPRIFIGRIISPFLRKRVLSDMPFGRNSPTDKSYIFPEALDFHEQKSKAIASVRKYYEGGPSRWNPHPHPFFGKFTPEEWAIFQWKHLDHHLRQFGV